MSYEDALNREIDDLLARIALEDIIIHVAARTGAIALGHVLDDGVPPMQAWDDAFGYLNEVSEIASRLTLEAYDMTADLYAGIAQL